MRLTVLLLLSLCLGATDADDMPTWAIPGIMAVETASSYATDGSIIYRNTAVGIAGELGCCQILRSAFDCVAKSGESFSRLGVDCAFSVDVARRYLLWIYEHKANRDWLRAVGMYNAGFGTDRTSINRRIAYLNKVRTKGQTHK